MKITRHTLIPLGADLLAMALAWGLVGWLRDSFVVRNTGAGLVLAAALILHFDAFSQLKKLALQPDGHAWPGLLPWLGEERRRVVAFLFSLFMPWARVDQSGFFRSLTQVELGDTGLSYHLMLGPLLWIVLAFLYMLVFCAPTDTTLDPADNRSAFTLFMALLVVNLMVRVVAGYFAHPIGITCGSGLVTECIIWYTKCITLWGTAVVVIMSFAAVYPVHAVIQPAIYRTGNRIFEDQLGTRFI